ncbi:Rho guanine nucleotide exchange factor 7 [Clydaea vesicula]|uniref:Rho guanine nucleotide exchange factor 7 n=1 Tax=Clydaea vesicula TaxID=447962 RepID=A0AAD5U3F6_9FUNG|nr:Rho guanine nucleotide exchange factor 7 [Clydaea vesicula]
MNLQKNSSSNSNHAIQDESSDLDSSISIFLGISKKLDEINNNNNSSTSYLHNNQTEYKLTDASSSSFEISHVSNVSMVGSSKRNSHFSNSSNQNYSSSPPHSITKPLISISNYHYTAEKNDELSFTENQIVRIISKADGGWWEGLIILDDIPLCGWFPTDYVTLVDNNELLNLSEEKVNSARLSNIKKNNQLHLNSPTDDSVTVTDNEDIVDTPRNLLINKIKKEENDFFESIERFVNDFVHPLSDETWFSKNDHDVMFGSIFDLHSFHQSLNKTLHISMNDTISTCFLQLKEEFEKVYSLHCALVNPAVEIASKYNINKNMLDFLQNVSTRQHVFSTANQNSSTLIIQLVAFLHRPLQRLPNYLNFLTKLVSETHSEHPDYAGCVEAKKEISEIINRIDLRKKILQNRDVVRYLSKNLENWEGPELHHYGELLYNGNLMLADHKKEVVFYLMEKLLVIVKTSNKAKKNLKNVENLHANKEHSLFTVVEKVLLVDVIVGKSDLVHDPNIGSSSKKIIKVLAFNPDQRMKWYHELEKAIDRAKRGSMYNFPSLPKDLQQEISFSDSNNSLQRENSFNLKVNRNLIRKSKSTSSLSLSSNGLNWFSNLKLKIKSKKDNSVAEISHFDVFTDTNASRVEDNMYTSTTLKSIPNCPESTLNGFAPTEVHVMKDELTSSPNANTSDLSSPQKQQSPPVLPDTSIDITSNNFESPEIQKLMYSEEVLSSEATSSPIGIKQTLSPLRASDLPPIISPIEFPSLIEASRKWSTCPRFNELIVSQFAKDEVEEDQPVREVYSIYVAEGAGSSPNLIKNLENPMIHSDLNFKGEFKSNLQNNTIFNTGTLNHSKILNEISMNKESNIDSLLEEKNIENHDTLENLNEHKKINKNQEKSLLENAESIKKGSENESFIQLTNTARVTSSPEKSSNSPASSFISAKLSSPDRYSQPQMQKKTKRTLKPKLSVVNIAENFRETYKSVKSSLLHKSKSMSFNLKKSDTESTGSLFDSMEETKKSLVKTEMGITSSMKFQPVIHNEINNITPSVLDEIKQTSSITSSPIADQFLLLATNPLTSDTPELHSANIYDSNSNSTLEMSPSSLNEVNTKIENLTESITLDNKKNDSHSNFTSNRNSMSSSLGRDQNNSLNALNNNDFSLINRDNENISNAAPGLILPSLRDSIRNV